MSKNRKLRRRAADAGPARQYPATVEDAIGWLMRRVSADVQSEIAQTPFEELIQFHRDFGMFVRNELGLWGRNPALLNSLPEQERWPDNASMFIIEALWRELRDSQRPSQSG